MVDVLIKVLRRHTELFVSVKEQESFFFLFLVQSLEERCLFQLSFHLVVSNVRVWKRLGQDVVVIG